MARCEEPIARFSVVSVTSHRRIHLLARVGESELTHPATRRNLMVRATLVAASTVQFEWIFGRDSRHRLEWFTE